MGTRTRVADFDEVLRWRNGLEGVLAPRRRRGRRAVGIALLLVVLTGSIGAYAYARRIDSLVGRRNVTLEPAVGGVLNILLLGSDSRAGLNNALDIARFGRDNGERSSDTIMLAQIVPGERRGVLLAFPRDLWVPVHVGRRVVMGKIDSAFGYGPQASIDTVEALTGIHINHYMEVDFAGFRKIVDAMGGVDLCLDNALYDSKLNFRLPAGTDHLDGNKSLSFVRSRYSTTAGDFDRIRRQEQFIRAVVAKLGRPSVLGNPIRVNSLANAFARDINVDQTLHLDQLVRLAVTVHSIGLDRLASLEVPGTTGSEGPLSVVFMDTQRATPLFAALREARLPTVPSQAVKPTPVHAATVTHTSRCGGR